MTGVNLARIKDRILKNLDKFRGKIAGDNPNEMDSSLNEGCMFRYTVSKLEDENGREYTMITSVTIVPDEAE